MQGPPPALPPNVELRQRAELARLVRLAADMEDLEEVEVELRQLRVRRGLVQKERAALPAVEDAASRVAALDVDTLPARLREAWDRQDVPSRRRALGRPPAEIRLTPPTTLEVHFRADLDGDGITLMPYQSPPGPP